MEDFSISFTNIEILNTLILNLYDEKPAIHTRISNFFRDMAFFLYFDRASVLIYYKGDDGDYRKQTSFTINWNTDLLKKYDSYYCRLDDTLAPLDRPEPTVIRSSSYFNSEQRMQTEYWKGYMEPNNADFEIMANLLLENEAKYRACVSFTRGKEAGDFNDYHMRILRLVQPHLSRLVQTYIKSLTANQDVFEFGDYNCVGYCILNDSCQILRKNGLFDKLNTDNRLLAKIVSLCMKTQGEQSSSDFIRYEYKFEDSPLFLELTRSPANIDGSRYRFCCLIYDLSHVFDITVRQAKQKYHLSDREYDILIRLLNGQKQEEIAASLYLSVPTIKKYVAALYEKLGITNQKQLFSRLNLL